MAKVVMNPNEQELTAKILAAREAERAGDRSKSTLDALGLDLHQLSAFAYKYFRMGEIKRALRDASWLSKGTDGPLDLVNRMIGYCAAARMFMRDGLPAEDETAQLAWSVWAHLRLRRGGAPLAPVTELRAALGDKLEELEGWSLWAQNYLSNELGNGTLWGGTQSELRYAMCRMIDNLQARAQRQVSQAAATEPWDKWAQQALGLSDAYVEDQKITTDDLRRMISERL
jgi:hypothetical protein